jgi:hypothetical protein
MAGKHFKNSLILVTILSAATLATALATNEAQAQRPAPPAGTVSPASVLDNFPHVTLSRGDLSARVYLPVPFGFYRGTRFDHAGIVTHATYKGQVYADYWFKGISANVHDFTYEPDGTIIAHTCCSVTGPAEEFDDIGYAEAGKGGDFLKIGVGMLRRNDETYDHALNYTVTNPGKRSTSRTKDSIRFRHVLNDRSGYGYDYVKTVTLVSGSQMTISHTLKNTGRKPLTTAVYAHNFLTLTPGNEGIELKAPFALKNERPLNPALAKVEGNTLRYVGTMTGQQSATSPFTGYGTSVSDFDFTVTATKSGFGQRIRADQPIARIAMWSVSSNFSWEPYVGIALQPGESKSWTLTYDFFGPGEK